MWTLRTQGHFKRDGAKSELAAIGSRLGTIIDNGKDKACAIVGRKGTRGTKVRRSF